MKIRKARQSDLPELTQMAEEFVAFHGTLNDAFVRDVTKRKTKVKKTYRKWFEKHLKKASSLVLVVESSKGLVGYCLALADEFPPMFSGRKNIFGKIADLYVKEEFRWTGLGRKMVKEVEKFFKRKGMRYISLLVPSSNPPAIKAYKSYGFREYLKEMMKRIG